MITKEAIEAGVDAANKRYLDFMIDDENAFDEAVKAGITAALAAMPSEREIDEGRFEQWTLADFAGQCRMQARDNLDPEYSQFMEALSARLSALAAMPGPAGVEVETVPPSTHVEAERLRRMVERRDEFIISQGLWDKFKEVNADAK